VDAPVCRRDSEGRSSPTASGVSAPSSGANDGGNGLPRRGEPTRPAPFRPKLTTTRPLSMEALRKPTGPRGMADRKRDTSRISLPPVASPVASPVARLVERVGGFGRRRR
jgi:hypothetical protein